MITANDLVSKFRQALEDNWGYIWGTSGVKWTAAKQKQLEQTTDSDRAVSRQYGSKWIGHYVADCSGLFVWAFKQLGSQMYHGSNTMYLKWCNAKGELKKGARADGGILKPGCAVFVWNGKNYSHVGLYVGDGTVIEAAGTKQGVITSKVSATKWTHWGELKDVSFDGAVDPAPAPAPEPERNTLRKGDKGEAVRELQTALMRLGYGLGSCGIDGDYGRATMAAVQLFQHDHGLTVDGICGPKTYAALDKALASGEPQKTVKYTVTICGLTDAKAKEIVNKYGGVITAE